MYNIEIFGKKYDMYFSVRANKEISRLCVDGSFDNFQRTLEAKNDDELLDFMANVAIILNKAAEQKNRLDSGETPKKWEELGELTMDIIDCMEPTSFVSQIMLPALTCISGDAEQSVETEPDEKNAVNSQA